MGRNFAGDAGTDQIDIGDITAARFLRLSTWTTLNFVRAETIGDDDGNIVSKLSGGSTTRQLMVRIDQTTAKIEVYQGGASAFSLRKTSTFALSMAVWYLIAVMNDGGGGGTGMRLVILGMDGTVHEDSTFSTDASDASDLTGAIEFGRRLIDDELDGDLAFMSYFTTEFSLAEVKEYLRTPGRVAARKAATCEYFMPLGLASPEIDLSGNGVTGTISGTPSVGDNPPVAPWYGGDADPALAAPAGAPPTGRIMSSLVGAGGLAGTGGIAGAGGGLAA